MRFAEWAPFYAEILAEFGYAREADERARDLLARLLADRERATRADVEALVKGEHVTVVGPASAFVRTREPDVSGKRERNVAAPASLPRERGVLVATDAALTSLLARGALPQVVVTDLDGDADAHVEASRRGALLVVHAHGDNEPALRAIVPRLEGPVLGTTQASPAGGVECFGGFTDGDRAVLLAAECGAREVTLVGFDFERPVAKAGRDAAVKLAKLAWARRLIGEAARRVPVAAAT